ncbi:hypothetical protein [Methylobacterium radiotolerans]|uniref:hypothetical protein n=1 Tax=Methylobacterium radiotolerans TaxID=31998 RepID=UPI000978B144|nr:hypothetical protein [Methylobacterium radiotolerans]ONF46458.1 hypothetical protein RSM1_24470 [Methylobacterium radiotolerans]
MTNSKAPRRLSDQARRQLYEISNTAREAADLAAAHASVGDVSGLIHELRRGIACQLSAIETLQALGEAERRPRLRLVA